MEDQKTLSIIGSLSLSDLINSVEYLGRVSHAMARLEHEALPNTVFEGYPFSSHSAFMQQVVLSKELVKRLSDITGIPAK